MSKKLLSCLALVLTLGGCAAIPEEETAKAAKTYKFDWPKEGIRATFEYKTLPTPQSKTTCAGKVSIENYGNRNYILLLFKVSVYSGSKELIATDRFSFSGTLNSGSRAEIPFDPLNPLDPDVVTKRYSECPKDMASADVKLEAF